MPLGILCLDLTQIQYPSFGAKGRTGECRGRPGRHEASGYLILSNIFVFISTAARLLTVEWRIKEFAKKVQTLNRNVIGKPYCVEWGRGGRATKTAMNMFYRSLITQHTRWMVFVQLKLITVDIGHLSQFEAIVTLTVCGALTVQENSKFLSAIKHFNT